MLYVDCVRTYAEEPGMSLEEAVDKAEFQGGYDAGYDEGYDSGYDEGYVSGVTEGIEALITTCKELGISYEQTSDKVREKYALTGEEVQQNMQKYW